MANTQDCYSLHRSALAPLLPNAPAGVLLQSCEHAVASGEADYINFLRQQGLAPLWDKQIASFDGSLPFSQKAVGRLHDSRLRATGNYLLQHHSLQLVRNILDEANVPHVITKGSHTRELYYDTPALRPAVDIDILIEPTDKITAIKAFQAREFNFHGAVENIAQDCSLIKGETAIDLHWDILRPGRTRKPMVNALLASRVDYGSHWGMSHGATLFLMLVHPVFRKYSTTPHASLVRLVDLAQLLHRHPESVDETVPLLHMAGLATAGWITLTWLHLLTGDRQAKSLGARLKPGNLRRKYLHNWLATNRSTKLLQRPLWIHLGFTLPAHDKLTDSMRAVREARRCKQDADATLAAMQKQVS
ncbi:MAG: nucleotidyltransferase family protein [Halioglobus sp.]